MNSTFDLENPAVKNGIIAGLASAAIILLFYLVSPRMVFTISAWITTILFIVFMVQSVKSEKSASEFTPFGEALKPAFLTYVIANLIYVIFYYVLFNFIAPELTGMQKEIAMEAMEKLGNLVGEDAMETAIDQLQTQDFTFTIKSAAWTFAWGLIFPGFIIAAIIALVMKDPTPTDA